MVNMAPDSGPSNRPWPLQLSLLHVSLDGRGTVFLNRSNLRLCSPVLSALLLLCTVCSSGDGKYLLLYRGLWVRITRQIFGLTYCKRQLDAVGHPVEFEVLDLASLQSVRRFVETFKGRDLRLHILVNNAAVMFVSEGCTKEGFEQHFGVNYLGHFLLTLLLLDILRHSGKCGSSARVVNVSSSAHRAGEIKLHDLQSRKCYSPHAAYCQSKLALLLFSSHLQLVLASGGFPVSSCAVDPGMVDTALYRHLPVPLRLAQRAAARLFFRTPSEGASTVLYSALSPSLEGDGGGYWANGRREMTSHPATHDPQLQLRLWDASLKLVGLNASRLTTLG
ncbi:dehydrogenase/reductase SDR family member on chromosome X-like isoform X1 [Osmerus eperlanus]|uniref:dehydrogenase/reductase SDR family member on chromosome X-like isoform X1 n=1 Tax=Osmerus eperlanus TaxID=29151 RepID=UPI002E0E315C